MRISSPAFEHQAAIPALHTCEGEDASPPLEFHDIPREARVLALIMDDPDAARGVWDHWIYYNIPAEMNGLPAAVPAMEYPPQGGASGLNSWRRVGYGGPCPQKGKHRYLFKLYALDAKLNLKAGAAKQHVLQAMAGHILAEAFLMRTCILKGKQQPGNDSFSSRASSF